MLRGLVIVCVLGLGCHGGAPSTPGPTGAGAEPVAAPAAAGTAPSSVDAAPSDAAPSAAPRQAKPVIAVLGLEVFDNGSGQAPDTLEAAKQLTAALRDRVRAGTGPYVLAPGSDRELTDEKMLSNCASEAATCMARVGAGLGADLLLYGKIEKVVLRGSREYKIALKLMSVARKQLASSAVELLSPDEVDGAKLVARAKAVYAKLVDAATGGPREPRP